MPYFFDTAKLKRELKRDMGRRLRQAREEAGFSIKDLALILEMTEKIYIKIEDGKLLLPCDKLFTLSKELGISLDWLVAGEERKPGHIGNKKGARQKMF